MKKEKLEFTLSHKEYLKGGTKEACVKVRDFLVNIKNHDDKLHAPDSCINNEEFVKAVKVLMAYTFRKQDEIPETWCCDSDCEMSSKPFCPGECNIQKNALKLCPFFMDGSNI